MALLRRSFFYYFLVMILINTIDLQQVHQQRVRWFYYLLSQGDVPNKINTRVQLYDYLSHLEPNNAQDYIQLGYNYGLLGNRYQEMRCYYKAQDLLKKQGKLRLSDH